MLILTSVVLGACASSTPYREPVTRVIPGPPSYLQPTAVPPATSGASPFVVAEQRKQVIVRQNSIIVGAKKAWAKMKETYGKSFLKR